MTRDPWRELLPPCVRLVQASREMWATPATAREQAVVERAVPQRQREFQAGRGAARAALHSLGITGFDLLAGAQRQPLWPEGVVGSITHARGHCAAAVALESDVLALGIDVEAATPLAPDLVEQVCSWAERRAVDELGDPLAALGAKLVFSAKEAVFKAYFPEVGQLLDFLDAQVTIRPQTGEFVAELHPGVPRLFGERLVTGRFALHDRLLFTAVAIPKR
jgi:4'-phosphopantetheinyl transferase EntD